MLMRERERVDERKRKKTRTGRLIKLWPPRPIRCRDRVVPCFVWAVPRKSSYLLIASETRPHLSLEAKDSYMNPSGVAPSHIKLAAGSKERRKVVSRFKSGCLSSFTLVSIIIGLELHAASGDR